MPKIKDVYVVVGYADEWYEDGEGIVFDNYADTLKYLKSNKLHKLIPKLDYLENIKDRLYVYDNKREIIVSYA